VAYVVDSLAVIPRVQFSAGDAMTDSQQTAILRHVEDGLAERARCGPIMDTDALLLVGYLLQCLRSIREELIGRPKCRRCGQPADGSGVFCGKCWTTTGEPILDLGEASEVSGG
jgi:hypothetical protein